MLGNFSVAQYQQDGFTGPVPLLSETEAAAGRQAFFTTIGQTEATAGPTKERTAGLNLHHRWVHDLATREDILDYVAQILGPDLVLWATVFWYKAPHNTTFIPWHQDATYWPMEPRINLTVWIAMGPVSRDNGCLRLIPGSHKIWMDEDYRSLTSDSAFDTGLAAEQVDESRALHLEMAPGKAVFFTEATLHGSDANRSDQPRLAFALRFATPEVRFDPAGLKEKGIDYLVKTMLVRGEDRYHHNESLHWAPPV